MSRVPVCTNVNAPAHMTHAGASSSEYNGVCDRHGALARASIRSPMETPGCRGDHGRRRSHSPPAGSPRGIAKPRLHSEEVRTLDAVSGQEGLQRAPRTRLNAKWTPRHRFARLLAFTATPASGGLRGLSGSISGARAPGTSAFSPRLARPGKGLAPPLCACVVRQTRPFLTSIQVRVSTQKKKK